METEGSGPRGARWRLLGRHHCLYGEPVLCEAGCQQPAIRGLWPPGSQMRTICPPGDIWQCFEMLFAVLTGWGRFLLASSGQRPEMLLNPATEHGTAHSPKCPEC